MSRVRIVHHLPRATSDALGQRRLEKHPALKPCPFTRTELPTAFVRWYHQLTHRLRDGFCRVCAGRLDGELVRPPGGTEVDPQPSRAAFECRRCGAVAKISGTSLATFHPVVEGFPAEHGFDVSARHPSQVWGDLAGFETGIRSDNPLQLAVTFTHAGERVTVDLAPDATVEAVRRHPVETDR